MIRKLCLFRVQLYPWTRDVALFLMLAVFSTPVASVSCPMAQNMVGDSELAGQLVFIPKVLSVYTLFIWIFTPAQMVLV